MVFLVSVVNVNGQGSDLRVRKLNLYRILDIHRGAPIYTTGFYSARYYGTAADAFKVDYCGTGYNIFNFLADGVPKMSMTKAGGLIVVGVADGGMTSYDLKVGDTATPSYGMIQIGDSVMGRTSYSAGNVDLDGAVLFRNMGGPVTGPIEFLWSESAGNTKRFALPSSGVANDT